MKTFLITLLIALMTVFAVQAQEDSQIVYYMTADENGIQQVYQMVVGEEARQLTHAESDVVNFGAAYDGLSIAYVSDGQLWLQPIHTEEAELLVDLVSVRYFSDPVYSPDGQYIAYADQGVWLFDLGTRETEQILTDVLGGSMGQDADKIRVFHPEKFVVDDEGKPTQLVVDVGVWEWNTAGIYDLESGDFVELEGQDHTSLLPLSDGRVLVYGNTGLGGNGSLLMADSADDINDAEEVYDFTVDTEPVPYAHDAIEIEPGVVRVYGPAFDVDLSFSTLFYFDFNIESGEASEVQYVEMGESENTTFGNLSPDGTLLPVYLNAQWSDMGILYGTFRLLDITTGEAVDAPFPDVVSTVHWQE